MIFQKNELYTEIKDCKNIKELYENRESIEDASVVLVYADDMADDACSEAAEWLSDASCITVIAAEDVERLSYDILSLFDVRIGGCEYPAEKARADEKYRLLCGSGAYFKLLNGKADTAPNFVTIPETDEDFASAAKKYIETICKDKTPSQLRILTDCLVKARKSGIESVFSAESEGFYELMSQKAEENADE